MVTASSLLLWREVVAFLVLAYMCWTDIRHRTVDIRCYYALVLVGVAGLIGGVLGGQEPGRLSSFILSVLSGLFLYVGLWAIGLYVALTRSPGGVPVNAIPSGDRLALLGLSVAIYNASPVPLVPWVLLFASLLGVLYGFLQVRAFKRVLDVPYLVPLTLGYLLSLIIL